MAAHVYVSHLLEKIVVEKYLNWLKVARATKGASWRAEWLSSKLLLNC